MKKKCYRCYQDKDENQFPIKQEKPMGICIDCYAKYYGDPYTVEEKRLQRNKDTNKRRQKRCQEFVRGLLTNSKCMDCGCDNWLVLEFDHRDPAKKYKDISVLVINGSINLLKEEIKKCDIICANCHRLRTQKQLGSWRLLFLEE